MFSRIIAAVLACTVLGACQTLHSPNRNIGMEDPAIGEAVRYNAAVHTINPDPVYGEDGAQPGDSGVKAAAAVKRYRTDQANARHRTEAKSDSSISTTSGPQ